MADIISDIEKSIKDVIDRAVKKACETQELNITVMPDYIIEVPREKTNGDFATNIAMLLPKQAKMPPRKIAEILTSHMDTADTYIEKVETAGPGFINFYLNNKWLINVIPVIEKEAENYGRCNKGQGKKINVEFVSANPTGPMHMGNARGAALGDSLANLLEAVGYDVTKEFYVNDSGNQIENFGKSLEARYLQLFGIEAEIPEEGYHGEDIIEHMRELIKIEGDKYLNVPEEERRARLTEYALEKNLARMKKDLADFGVEFDIWFSEQTLHKVGKVEQTIDYLKEKGYTYESEDALWFKASQFGAEKDEVLIRSNGLPTYFAADIAYHKNKFERGFEIAIDIWGADHHGHIPRMKGAVEALGYNPDRLHVIIMQLVRLYRQGEIARMSKRTGRAVTLSDLIEEVGRDAARFFFNMRSADTHLDFDLDLAVTQSTDNPVFYVQYAHARICSILRQAEENGITILPAEEANLEVLTEESELAILRKLADFPSEILNSALAYEPYHLTRYSLELSSLFHTFYNSCRVIGQEENIMIARLLLIKSVKQVLKNTLTLLGITAPERM
ncbi:MAG TPA: arginine--tRNA ligase [Thermoanaerobacterales bacterium]|nr:arginine--tRNA ligase [Thermoanaerobacterales bacterium]